jgi:DNA-binding NarL/FixJ family response regulator
MAIRVLLADDHKIFREGLKNLLAQESDLSIVADTDDGAHAVELALSLTPDIAILDISMPNLNGIEAARRVVDQGRGTRVIILSMHMDKEYVAEALKAGAQGVLAKTCSSRELVDAIRLVAAGEPYLSSTISSALVGIINSPKHEGLASSPSRAENKLSQRENEVLRLLAEGHCTKEVAALLNISSKTVETYRLNLMKKLQITSVVSLVKYAIREGIVELS